jgi:hypothetical protein
MIENVRVDLRYVFDKADTLALFQDLLKHSSQGLRLNVNKRVAQLPLPVEPPSNSKDTLELIFLLSRAFDEFVVAKLGIPDLIDTLELVSILLRWYLWDGRSDTSSCGSCSSELLHLEVLQNRIHLCHLSV